MWQRPARCVLMVSALQVCDKRLFDARGHLDTTREPEHGEFRRIGPVRMGERVSGLPHCRCTYLWVPVSVIKQETGPLCP